MGANKVSAVQIGKIFKTNTCGDLLILETYPGKALVRFLSTGYERLANKPDILHGKVTDPYCKNIYGVGFLGEGPYHPKNCRTNYNRWLAMLSRCYNPKDSKFEYYENCFVVEDWHNFQNYMSWAVLQKGFDKTGWQIDKDLLSKSGPTYGPENCVFLPKDLNMALITQRRVGNSLGAGVYYHKNNKKYVAKAAQASKNKGTKYIGSYDTKEEAHEAYKKCKEEFVKHLADKFKEELSKTAYEELYKWTVP